MGQLTTHVLDTALGRPAKGVAITVYRLDGGAHEVAEAVTNADGRCDAPLLEGAALEPGTYEMVFAAGDYLESIFGAGLPEPKFLDEIPIRFGIASPEQGYHVPLLLSPYGYSTYRGS